MIYDDFETEEKIDDYKGLLIVLTEIERACKSIRWWIILIAIILIITILVTVFWPYIVTILFRMFAGSV